MNHVTSRREPLRPLRIEQYPSANAGLWLDKYLNKPLSQSSEKKDEAKSRLVKEVARIEEPDFYKDFYEKRWLVMLDECGAQNPREVRVSGRMAVGLGADSVLETSIALHRTYGVPYIPASALKGLARRYARLHLERVGGEWTREHTDELFGTTEQAGYVTFFDALYVPGSGREARKNNQTRPYPLHPDVMTVHHPEYYQDGKKPPADWDDPIPVPFLSATGRYLLAVAASDAEEWCEVTLTVLARALKEEGIGAKTSSGYGRLR